MKGNNIQKLPVKRFVVSIILLFMFLLFITIPEYGEPNPAMAIFRTIIVGWFIWLSMDIAHKRRAIHCEKIYWLACMWCIPLSFVVAFLWAVCDKNADDQDSLCVKVIKWIFNIITYVILPPKKWEQRLSLVIGVALVLASFIETGRNSTLLNDIFCTPRRDWCSFMRNPGANGVFALLFFIPFVVIQIFEWVFKDAGFVKKRITDV